MNNKKQINIFSPGRINLIGEHIDYNGGYVLPAAISLGTKGTLTFRDDKVIKVKSKNFPNEGTYTIDFEEKQVYSKENGWSNIARGVIEELKKDNYKLTQGFELELDGQIPYGSGLSSSASAILLIIEAFDIANNWNIASIDKAFMTKRVENNFLNTKTGIMDQYVITFGKKNKALYLDTSIPKHTYIDCDLKEYKLLIVSTNKKRELSESKYNERVSECFKGISIIQEHKKVKQICELGENDWKEIKDLFTDEIIKNRVEHCIFENERTKKAADALKSGDIKKFGKLLYESHESLKDLYEVTGEHLDFIYNFSRKFGSIGARMTGAGFGGCGIVLLKENEIDSYKKEFEKEYKEKFAISPSFYQVEIAKGISDGDI